ncbi:MAG TPA: NADH-quinone oxidoreductase subunit M, partial [Ktedonobacterales bacterium]|nr:NADH-quinone oxidoreductase subunit M [Ktedonobacterales bacterium]
MFPILSLILFLPLAGAIGAAALPRLIGWGWAMGCALVDLAVSLWLITQFSPHQTGFQFVEHAPWLPDIGASYSLGVDGVNLFLLSLNALLTVVALAASWRTAQTGARSQTYLALMMLLACGMQGVFLATNLFLFYVFWELMLVPAYLLVGMFGGPRRTYAAIKFVLYTAVGSLLMLIGIIAIGSVTSGNGLAYSLDLTTLINRGVPPNAQTWLFLAFFAAFAVKAGLFPLHNWVPDTYSEAPAAVVVMVAGVMAKTGTYGMLRFCLTLFPQATQQFTPYILGLSVIGILYFALQALVASDFKRLLSYVSVSHMSVIILGIFALNTQGIEGAVVQMVNHGIIIAALFLIAGFIETRIGSRKLSEFGALATRMPWLATVFLLASLAALGLPGLNSFAGEFLAFLGAFHHDYRFGVLATLVVIPAAWYMLRFFQGVMEGPAPATGVVATALGAGGGVAGVVGATGSALASGGRVTRRNHGGRGRRGAGNAAGPRDLTWGEFVVLAPLLALIIALGLAPGVLTARIEPAAQPLSAQYALVAPTHVLVDARGASPSLPHIAGEGVG